MKEIQAFVHRGRIADIVRALGDAGFQYLSVIDVKGLLHALSSREQRYSIELGERVIDEVRLELFCHDERADLAVRLIRQHGHTGQEVAGWVYQRAVEHAWPIDGYTGSH